MQDLSKWSYADDFTPYEASCLIVGLDPDKLPEDARAVLVMQRMEKAYGIALEAAADDVWGGARRRRSRGLVP
jgi:hypothetical protein